MLIAKNLETYTKEEYFAFEEKSESKHEFYYGKLFEMPGAPVLHNNICLKLFLILTGQLKDKGYQINVENVKVKVENEEVYVYPDVVVTTEMFQSMSEYVIYQPILIAEVLSDSTRKYDSTDKFIQYQKISTLKYYLLVEPEKHVVIFYEKKDNEWTAKTYTDLDEVISLINLNAQITLGDIYQ